ncbi:Holliday junction branch migration protein RuvA [Halovulum dunhuangense]|uniref:Holliday junction branch migration complex subunit RuvA n=1 Tax=Halovulum dunhuangense TaxID=1505036 RepID=A0A849L505_9RHOB|nr:Holliday junction branch migration protein RuvA [Halovulum dunhuangense]NNU81270.1 Holliday junction branch migration protein RuvA [Halovulum dunhuangense]
MIGKVTGRIDYRAADHVLIEAHGVGYVVYCSDRTLAALPGPGAFAALYTELVVREDLLQLFGFLTLAEKEWHRLLTSVQGIGARGALAILGTLGPEGIARAITLGDMAAVRKAPGVGPKTAQRVILELKDKAPAMMALGAKGAAPASVIDQPDASPEPRTAAPAPVAVAPDAGATLADARADALSALVNLGYGQGDAASAVARAESEGAEGTQALIRTALRLLAPKG